jgi:Carboxylesterase family
VAFSAVEGTANQYLQVERAVQGPECAEDCRYACLCNCPLEVLTMATTTTTARTSYGILRGVAEDDLVTFRGIPYASPPIGHRRFSPLRG